MDTLEQELRKLKLRQPSAELDRRIAAALAGRPQVVKQRRWVVSPRWAAAAIVLTGLLAFLAGRLSTHQERRATETAASASAPASPSVTVRVVYEGRGGNPFDCTTASDDGIRPRGNAKSTSEPGV